MSDVCWMNGDFRSESEATISVFDRGLLFGDSIYEVLRVHNGRLFQAPRHYMRMCNGLAELGISPPMDEEAFVRILTELAERNAVRDGIVYLQVSRGACARTHLVPKDLSPTVFALAKEVPLPSWSKHPQGVSVLTVPEERWRRCRIKTTMLLPNTLAKQKAVDAGAYEAVFVTDDGDVREGTSSNVFAVFNGRLRTPPADGSILPGITRDLVLELAEAVDLPAEEKCFTLEELLRADEVFLTGTTNDVCPVARVNETTIGQGAPGFVTRKLMEAFAKELEALDV